MRLTLSPEEARELHDVLTSALSEIRSEIHHTDAPEFRERLQDRERILRRIWEQLGPAEASS